MIKHMVVSMAKYGKPEEENYLCHPVPFVNIDKLAYNWDKTTCKKCLRKRYD